ncbi:MAG TPA: FADH(2)-oxidizing methylenetetrahydrofolate--tRNA-(uracil(54)-C(5))-methyltransferase TrmFO [Nitrospiraceae bacterium]|nr:MAG: methylenetetrahydrofolate--tRNA-(uracil(54)-C(5))-methyltransferase (FADH(2)-oxidizing) TrmFO [Nitrospirae bacterium GWA2_46_11]OGW26137.1 MAG: methylenetetrahydrofolate--tRNA-(uracil(54)-C(5))-methyltransferase (FADH(2)-oxidizing) TrmFO [Nitrospirae bacterium GWB2_47_37]HAK89404.1 FADH(2)-oxidizing methylenetetrahydrofolate--tRNA-(uracil(54)-C(5))-methyltransferase TrmFO [Nitrospiraceae bacterium]HCZ11203.1 FADH(2)-oxidizing methylenetetrahydrofolate--tRNA-(uracil(54)-C(5))-methyltransf
MDKEELIVIGGGLAGCEAAWQAARLGVNVLLFEMRPERTTEAHKTGSLAELVCSNSLRSKEMNTGPGLLKRELQIAGSLVMNAAKQSEVSAGSAFAVDRTIFSDFITEVVEKHPAIKVIKREVTELPDTTAIIATGPLTSSNMADSLKSILGEGHLHFYDAIAPILDAESIDYSKAYLSSRYGKGGDDYANCPMNKEEYDRFYDALMDADTVTARDFEDIKVFEGCMPVEVMAHRGRDTLRFGPLKPVGLIDPKTGKIPYAVVQLRPENRGKTAYNMVGFQTRLRRPEQKKVFRLIPGLENAEFLRLGSIHRNTYINSPRYLQKDLSLKNKSSLYLAGQITGVEGYIESTAMGLIAGINAARRMQSKDAVCPPRASAHGSLLAHITESDPENFQPSNINFGLMPAGEEVLKIRDKKIRRQRIAEIAIKEWEGYVQNVIGDI